MNRGNIFSISLVSCFLIALLTLTGCTDTPVVSNKNISSELSGSQELKKFSSMDEFRQFMELSSENSRQGNFGGIMMGAAVDSVAAPMGKSVESTGGGASDYSQTNVQIQGVDEADFVKNDGKYIYLISAGDLIIIDAADGKNSSIISDTKVPLTAQATYYYNSIRDMFLNGDKVVLFVDSYEPEVYFNKYDIQPIEGNRQNTKVLVYDVSDRENPDLVDEYSVSGNYYSSRMIGDVVYVISQEYMFDWRYYDGPMIAHAKDTIKPDIYYFDNPEQNYVMNTITSIDLDSSDIVDSMSLLLGYSNTLMVSEDNIYIAYQKQQRWCWGWRCSGNENDSRERFVNVVVPLLKGDLKSDIQSVLNKDLSQDEEWTQISEVLSSFFKELKDDEKLQEEYSSMFEDIQDALNEYDSKKALEDSKTIIHKIAIDGGKLEYKEKAEVDGRLVNQFAMDEYDGNLRVATTVSLWLSRGSVQYNNVYVLNQDMKVIGELQNLAQNESIYSTRFMGDKLYMVTFRQMDPFFVVDLKEPTQPKVLGYLKIPGYSSYLHPINDKYIIGVGKDTGENEWGGISAKGVKITLFDVSDFENPKEVDTKVIGLEGSDTPVLYDHKAFLYSPSKNMLVLPVTEVTDREKSGTYDYRSSIWYGAYVFEVSEDGFTELGKIKHSNTQTQYYYWSDASNVKRSLYMGDVLYTFSDRYVKVNDLADDLKELNSIRLPIEDSQDVTYPEKPIPVDIGGGIATSIAR